MLLCTNGSMPAAWILLTMFKGPHVSFILHDLIIQQLLTKLSFCDFFSHKVQSFKWREVAVYLCSLKENIQENWTSVSFIFAMWKRQNKEETGDMGSQCFAYCEDHGNPSSLLWDNTSLCFSIKENSSCLKSKLL